MRYPLLGVVLVAALAGCGRGGGFCDTVRELNDAGAAEFSASGDAEAARRAMRDMRERVDRQVELLDRLERTAPDDLRADVAVVADVGRRTVRVVLGGELSEAPALMAEQARALPAHQRVAAATAERCGEGLHVLAP